MRVCCGTALNGLHCPKPQCCSEDLDLVPTCSVPVDPVIGQLRDAPEPWMEQPRLEQSHLGPKFRVRIDPAVGNGKRIRLKVEMNTCEIDAFDGPAPLPLAAESPWFSGEAEDSTIALRLAWTALPTLVPFRWCIRLRPVQVKRTVVVLPAPAHRRLDPGRLARLHVLPVETARIRQQAFGPAEGDAP